MAGFFLWKKGEEFKAIAIEVISEATLEKKKFATEYELVQSNLEQQKAQLIQEIPKEQWLITTIDEIDYAFGVAYSNWGGSHYFLTIKVYDPNNPPLNQELDKRYYEN